MGKLLKQCIMDDAPISVERCNETKLRYQCSQCGTIVELIKIGNRHYEIHIFRAKKQKITIE